MTSPNRGLSTATGATGGRSAASRRRPRLATALACLGALGASIVAAAMPVEAASLNLSWQAPTTDLDDSPLTDLSSYNVYVATSSPACQSVLPIKVISPVAAPKNGDVISYQVSGATAGTTYAVAVSAINRAGIEGPCSPEAIGVARSSFTVTPGRLDFGSADVGTSVDRTFTVGNVGTASLSVMAVVPAPFAVVSGGPYTVLPGATQNNVIRFSPTIDATFSTTATVIVDRDTLSVAMTGTATRPSDPPGSRGPSLTIFYGGKLRDRVGADNVGLGGDGAVDGTLTATLTAAGGRTITRLQLQSSAPGSWDTDAATSAWALGVASTLDGPLLNDAAMMAVNFTVADGGTFRLFAADYADLEFAPGVTLTLTATFSDGTTAAAVAIATAVVPTDPPSLALTYDGKLRDNVGQGSVGLGGDGAPDGTLTATLSAPGGRTITRLRLQSSAPGSWDTDATRGAWVLGVARTLDSALLNDPGTMAVNFVVADGGSFRVFAADFAGLEFAPGRTLTLA
ncbi:MAG TPA: hypothetical protein VEQ67_11655, partial [Mycobacterium sp.]|nr:hypothetical protein [Mycobacterium sp.]